VVSILVCKEAQSLVFLNMVKLIWEQLCYSKTEFLRSVILLSVRDRVLLALGLGGRQFPCFLRSKTFAS
jgi:hypothetical protein